MDNHEYNQRFIEILSKREKIFKDYALKCNMSEAEHWLLYTVYVGGVNGEEYTQKDCSELWAFPKQTIHSASKKLLERGLIYLELNQNDRREKVLKLTDFGLKVSNEIMKPLIDCENCTFSILNQKEKEMFIGLLEKIYHELQVQMDALYEKNQVDFEIVRKG